MKSYGRTPTFLMATGFEQARSVVAAIAGDLEAADRVELELPETGVCGTGTADTAGAGSGCCGDAPAATGHPAVGILVFKQPPARHGLPTTPGCGLC